MGCAWIPIGVTTDNQTFTIIGLLFIIVGLRNKKKWKENRLRWSDLSKAEKTVKITVFTIILFSLSVAVLMYLNQ